MVEGADSVGTTGIFYLIIFNTGLSRYLQEYLGIFRIGDNIEEVLWEDVECVGVVQGEHEDCRLRELVVARGDARHSLHPFKKGQAHEIM